MTARRVAIAVTAMIVLFGMLASAQEWREIRVDIVDTHYEAWTGAKDLAWDSEKGMLLLLHGPDHALYRFDPRANKLVDRIRLEEIPGIEDIVPASIAWLDGRLLIADADSLAIHAVDLNARSATEVYYLLEFQRLEGVRGIPLLDAVLSGLAADPAGQVLVSFQAGYSSSTYRISLFEGLFVQHFWAAGGLPMDLTVIGDSIWGVDGSSPPRIYELTQDGEPTGAFIELPEGRLGGVAFDGERTLWVSSVAPSILYRIELSEQVVGIAD